MKQAPFFKLTKRFATISFLAITVSAVLIFLFFRYEAIQSIEQNSRDSNAGLTIGIEYALNDHFVNFLRSVESENKERINQELLDPLLKFIKSNSSS